MLYDLNIPWSPATKVRDLEETLRFSASLGYGVVALTETLSHPIPARVENKIPQLGRPSPHHPPASQPQREKKESTQQQPGPSIPLPTTLRRATVVVADPAVNHRLAAVAAAYDVLAVRPTTEKAFLAACTSMTEPSLISLDLTQFFPFYFRPKPAMAAVHRGLRFEICYGQAVSSTDPRARATFLANVAGLVRATRGRGIVVSSEARGALGLRGPADAVNLCAVWGMSADRATESLGVNPRGVVVNEGLRRRGFRGVVDVVQGAGMLPPLPKEAEGSVSEKSKKGRKRKETAGDGGDGGGGGGGGGGGETKLSNREAKKLKRAEEN